MRSKVEVAFLVRVFPRCAGVVSNVWFKDLFSTLFVFLLFVIVVVVVLLMVIFHSIRLLSPIIYQIRGGKDPRCIRNTWSIVECWMQCCCFRFNAISQLFDINTLVYFTSSPLISSSRRCPPFECCCSFLSVLAIHIHVCHSLAFLVLSLCVYLVAHVNCMRYRCTLIYYWLEREMR